MDTKLPDVKKVVFTGPKKVQVVEEPDRKLGDGEFRVETLYSAISAGTELTFFNGTNPKSSEGWDKELRLFRGDLEPDLQDVYPKLDGYMESAVVTESRRPDVAVGAHVAAMYGHKDRHIMTPQDFWIPLPPSLPPLLGTMVAQMGPVCMNGILYTADELHRAAVDKVQGSLAGQRIVVFGAGVVGLLCGVFAKWAGAEEVLIVDGIEERLEVASQLGLKAMHARTDLPITLKAHWKTDDPLNTGADFALQCTGSDFLLAQAFSCLREQGTVIDLGFYQQGAPELQLGKNFHHNRLRHVCAQIGALPRHQQPAWNKTRLAEATIEFLQAEGEKLEKLLVTDRFSFADAQTAYERLSARDPRMLQVVMHP